MKDNEEIECYDAEVIANEDNGNKKQSLSDNFNKKVEVINRGIDVVKQGLDVYRESLQISRDVARIECATNIKLADIAAKYSICQEMLMAEYGQRDKALGKHYDILDKAIANDDREMVVTALKGISTIVTTSPADSFEKFLEAWNNNSKPLELDF